MRTIVRFTPGRLPGHSWVILRTIVSFLRTGRSRQPEPEQLCGLDATANPDTEQFGVDPGYAAARNTEQFKPDQPESPTPPKPEGERLTRPPK